MSGTVGRIDELAFKVIWDPSIKKSRKNHIDAEQGHHRYIVWIVNSDGHDPNNVSYSNPGTATVRRLCVGFRLRNFDHSNWPPVCVDTNNLLGQRDHFQPRIKSDRDGWLGSWVYCSTSTISSASLCLCELDMGDNIFGQIMLSSFLSSIGWSPEKVEVHLEDCLCHHNSCFLFLRLRTFHDARKTRSFSLHRSSQDTKS